MKELRARDAVGVGRLPHRRRRGGFVDCPLLAAPWRGRASNRPRDELGGLASSTTRMRRAVADLLRRHPALIKRPVIVTGDEIYLGCTTRSRRAHLLKARPVEKPDSSEATPRPRKGARRRTEETQNARWSRFADVKTDGPNQAPIVGRGGP